MTTFGKHVKMNFVDDRRDSSDRDNQPLKLPQTFVVKYLGHEDAQGLWGIKNTRKPVDHMVELAKKLKAGTGLPFLQLKVSEKGVMVTEMPQNANKNFAGGFFGIDSISYGVQDLVYTRVFAMIVVSEYSDVKQSSHPFQCHGFVCESRQIARNLTFALATAFQAFSREVQANKGRLKKFAIDLRTPEEIEADNQEEVSEA